MFLLLVAALAVAQTSLSGGIGGAARDGQRAVVAHARIALRNSDTGERFTAETGSDGGFRVVGLKPGNYSLIASGESFADFRLLEVTVEVGRVTEVEIAFAPASAHESVEVRDEAPAVNTLQPAFATNVDDALMEKLPINGRRWSNFALLTPGATLDDNFGLISFRGINGLMNNSTVDGADNNQAFFSEERGRTRISYVISQEAVREFQVNTSNFSAEYGRAAGAVVNAVTRSGTNRVRGSIFYFMRDNALGATNAFTVVPVHQTDGSWTSEQIKPLDRRQQFGGSVGGPIVKDKLFYFATLDFQRRDYPAVAAAANTSTFFAPPCVIPLHYAGMNAAKRAQVQQCGTDNSDDELYTLERYALPRNIPDPDTPAIAAFQGGQAYLASLLGPVARTADHQIAMAKIDYHINERNTLGVSYNRLRFSSPGGVQTEPVVARGIASFGFDGVKVDTLTARLASTLGHSLFNELRYSWSRDFEYQVPQAPAPGEPVGPSGLAPSVSVEADSSGFSFGTPTSMPRRALPDEYRNEVAETLGWMWHRHLLKFGLDANRVVDEMNNLYATAGEYTYYHRDSFIADLCKWPGSPISSYCPNPIQDPEYDSYRQGFGTPAFRFHTIDGALFAQDDWRALRRLTLSFGLRYEFELLPSPQVPNPMLAGSQHFPSDMNNFGPRFGFALALTSDGKTALRGGYGIYYARISNSTISAALTNTGTEPAQRSYTFKNCYLYATNCLQGPASFPEVNVADPYTATNGGNVAVFGPHMRIPQIHQADLIVERQIARNTVLSASYLLSLGRELPNFVDINLDPSSIRYIDYAFTADYRTGARGPYYGHALTVPVYTARLNPNFQTITQIESNVNSSYSALVLQLNRTSVKGLGFRMNYTWSHAIDDGQNSITFSNYNNTSSPIPYTYWLDGVPHHVARPDYGTSNYDIRQRLVASIFWSPRLFSHSRGVLHDALDHWTMAPIVQIATGKPYSDHVSGDAPPIGNTSCAGCLGFMGNGGQERLPFVGRNHYRYGNLYNTDLRLSRMIYFGEAGRNVELLAEAFNLFNHQIVTSRDTTMYSAYNSSSGPTLEYDSNFGAATAAANTIYREREIQLGVRAHF